MLDVQDFITDRGGDPKKLRENQRRRNAPEGVVDEIIALFDDHRRSESLPAPFKPHDEGLIIVL